MNDYKEKAVKILKFFSNRLFIMTIALFLSFTILVSALFERQIVEGHFAVPNIVTSQRIVPINAPRGEIFDVNGLPLAINTPVFTVLMDPSIVFAALADPSRPQFDLNTSFLFFMDLMARHGETINIHSEFLISAAEPRTFSASSAAQRRWMLDLRIEEDLIDTGLSAAEAYEALLEIFNIPADISAEDAHTLLVMRTALELQRLNLHQIPLAAGIDSRTVAALEEHSQRMPGIYVAFDYLRSYPMGKYMTSIIGYLIRINQADLTANEHLGYTATDLFGIDGLERAFEHNLRGTRGATTIEVSGGRRINVLNEEPPIPGDNIHLTVDAVLQRNIYYILEDVLSTILINRLRSSPVSFSREIVESMLRGGRIDAVAIVNAEEEDFPASHIIGNFVRTNIDIDLDATNARTEINNALGEAITAGRVNIVTMLIVMEEQGIISISEQERISLSNGQMSAAAFLTARIDARDLTPHMINISPATGSVVVTDVRTGGILAAVSYPTFDANNLLPHSFDIAYFNQINRDPANPQLNRAFTEAHAPGSTFKMITALAALSQGIITPETRIFDNVVFRDAGVPYLRSWSSASFGSINVADAIAVSSNYFFSRVAWDMGNHRNGRTLEGIATLNHYMKELGLGSPTGVEIREMNMFTDAGTARIASPEYRTARGGGAWFDGDTARVSIGQGDNTYTSASMAKYFAALATGGTRMQMHLLDRIVDAGGNATPFEPVVEHVIDVEPRHMEAIHRGMFDTAFSARGTGRGIFAGIPIAVGVKSGTAETGTGISHSTYGGFAPFDDPQIAVFVMMPFGDTQYLRNSAGHVLRAVFDEYFGFNRVAEANGNNGLAR